MEGLYYKSEKACVKKSKATMGHGGLLLIEAQRCFSVIEGTSTNTYIHCFSFLLVETL